MTHAALVAVILAMPSPDRVDAEALASAIEATTKNPDWAALELAVMENETHLSQRIIDGHCKPWECDRGKAWGIFQEHRNAFNARDFGSLDLTVQVRTGYEMLSRAYWSCSRFFPKNPSPPVWVRFTINAFAGKRCDAEWGGLETRWASFTQIRNRL